MPVGPDFTRSARPEEREEIEALLVAAFGRSNEAELVRRLRSDGDMWEEVVKPWGGGIAGYAAISRMRSPEGWGCLAPLAVLPRCQRGAAAPSHNQSREYAVGTRLAREIASTTEWTPELRATGKDVPDTIVVVGRRQFYERAGFSWDRAQALDSPYPLAHTLIARRGLDVPTGQLVYPPAFSKVE